MSTEWWLWKHRDNHEYLGTLLVIISWLTHWFKVMKCSTCCIVGLRPSILKTRICYLHVGYILPLLLWCLVPSRTPSKKGNHHKKQKKKYFAIIHIPWQQFCQLLLTINVYFFPHFVMCLSTRNLFFTQTPITFIIIIITAFVTMSLLHCLLHEDNLRWCHV